MVQRVLLAAAVALSCATAAAQDPAAAGSSGNAWAELGERYYVTPSLAGVLADSGRQTDPGFGLNLAIGRRWSDVLALEAVMQYTRLEHERGSETADVVGLGINGLFFPSGDHPAYLLLGAGYADVGSHPGADEDYGAFQLSVGAGYWWKPLALGFDKLSLRTEFGYRLDAHNDRRTGADTGSGRKAFGDLVFGVGLNIPIGEPPAPPPPAAEVVDVVAVVAAPDTDADGVADALDQCPGTAAGTAVDSLGCPVASVSACRAPTADTAAEFAGCAVDAVLVLEGVQFETDRDRLTEDATVILDRVATGLQAAPSIQVELRGHTDAQGAESYNQVLSQRRACAAARHLKQQGVEATRLSASGEGARAPVADNQTDEGRQRNRRVELRIVNEIGQGLAACTVRPSPANRVVKSTPPAVAAETAETDSAVPSGPAGVEASPALERGSEGGQISPAISPTSEAQFVDELPEPEPAASTPAPVSTSTAPPSAPQQVPESEVFEATTPGSVPSDPDQQPPRAEQVPESEVFEESAPDSAIAPTDTSPATPEQVPESEVFDSSAPRSEEEPAAARATEAMQQVSEDQVFDKAR